MMIIKPNFAYNSVSSRLSRNSCRYSLQKSSGDNVNEYFNTSFNNPTSQCGFLCFKVETKPVGQLVVKFCTE